MSADDHFHEFEHGLKQAAARAVPTEADLQNKARENLADFFDAVGRWNDTASKNMKGAMVGFRFGAFDPANGSIDLSLVAVKPIQQTAMLTMHVYDGTVLMDDSQFIRQIEGRTDNRWDAHEIKTELLPRMTSWLLDFFNRK